MEQYHFNDEVFRLVRGKTGQKPTGDIAYTLHAFPNHHRALDAFARLHRREQVEKLPRARYSLACYFDRAGRMAPNDPVVPMLKAIHLFKTDRLEAAEEAFVTALQLAPNSAEILYNLGLLYARKRDYESARHYAVKAYDLGFPLPGLRDQLIRANQWPDETEAERNEPLEVDDPGND